MRAQHLKILYALAGSLLAGYWSQQLIAYHVANHVPISIGTMLCLLLFVSIPASGFVLLFVLFPWAIRFVRR